MCVIVFTFLMNFLLNEYLYTEIANKALFWQQQNYYGVDLTALHGTAFQGYFSQPVVDAFDPRLLVAPAVSHVINFTTVKEEVLSDLNSPAATCNFTGVKLNITDKRMPSLHVRHSLIDQMNIVDGQFREPNTIKYSKYESWDDEHKTSLVTGTTG